MRPLYALAVAFLAGVVAVVYCTPLIRGPLSDTRFSSERWLDGDVRVRGQMARDLVKSRQLQEKSPEEVRAILGDPDVERFGGQTIRYRVDVGYRWIVRPHLYDLVIRFGKGDEVFQVAIEPSEDG
jgi:hypothetical protein